MTQPLAVGQIIKAQLWSVQGEQAAVNTFHYKVNALVPTAPNLEDFAASFENAAFTSYLALLCVQARFQGALCQIVSPLPIQVAVISSTHAGQALAGTIGLPRQVSGLITWQTDLAGPGGRGRTYVPFPAEEDNELNGTPSADYVTRLTTFAAAVSQLHNIPGGAGSATVQIGVKSQNSANFVPYTHGRMNSAWATQRRRGQFGRANTSPV